MATILKQVLKTWPLGFCMIAFLAHSHSASAACLTKPLARASSSQIVIFMLAPSNEVAAYQALGFQVTACPKDMTSLRDYVDRICSGSGNAPLPPINTDKLFGRPRTSACLSARAGLAEAGG